MQRIYLKNCQIAKLRCMKKLFLLLTMAAITFSSCEKNESVAPPIASIVGKWQMVMVKDIASGTTVLKTAATDGNVELLIVAKNANEGTFTGNTSVNTISENALRIGEDQFITIPALSMTKVAEPNWGNLFVKHILGAEKYSVEIEGKLIISTPNKILYFQKIW